MAIKKFMGVPDNLVIQSKCLSKDSKVWNKNSKSLKEEPISQAYAQIKAQSPLA